MNMYDEFFEKNYIIISRTNMKINKKLGILPFSVKNSIIQRIN